MEVNPLVSIIVRTKDRPKLLKNAIKSIANQTYRPIEVVLVNDGGCDLDIGELKDILGDISLNYIRLEKNTGRAHAGNVGIENARGEYIGFLDDDDEYLPTCIEKIMGARSDNMPIYGKVIVYDAKTNKKLYEIFEQFSVDRIFFSNYIPIISLFIPKNIIPAVGYFDENFYIFEDWDWIYRLAKVTPFNFIKEDVSVYKIFGEATITGRYGQQLHDKARRDFYLKHYNDLNINRLINMEKIRLETVWEINDLKRDLGEKDARIGELSWEVNELKRVLHEKDTRIGELSWEVNELKRILHEKDARIGELSWEVNELKRVLHEKETSHKGAIQDSKQSEISSSVSQIILRGNYEIIDHCSISGKPHSLIKRADDGYELWIDDFFVELIENLQNTGITTGLHNLITKWDVDKTVLEHSINILINERILIPE